MTTYPEERVLKPLNPVPDDENEWPDFALREVKIFYQGKGRYADLLEASEKVPLCVLGELMPVEDEQERLSLLGNSTFVRIKLENVTNYSYGINDDGKPAIWAAGKAGWYELTPSDRYLSHYNDTAEAIDMFYFMVDQHQKLSQKRKRLGFQIDPFLKAYQKHTDYRVDDDDEAMEILHKHHRFLLGKMLEEREGIDWSQTHLWNHLAETYSEVIDELRGRLSSPVQGDVEMEPESEEESEQDVEGSASDSPESEDDEAQSSDGEASEITAQAISPKSEKSSKSAGSSQGSDASSDDEEDETDWTKPVWTLLNVLRKSPNFDIKTAGIEDVAQEVVKLPGFTGKHKTAITAIERSAEPLLRLMNEAKLRKKFNWSTRAIYAELEATLADEVAEDIRTPVPRASKKKHRLKSVLRPSGASKASKRTSSMPSGQLEEDDDEDMRDQVAAPTISSPAARRQRMTNGHRRDSLESGGSRMDSPSRQLNGDFDANALPDLPPGPETQELLDLVRGEAKKHGRINQTSHLEALLGRFNGEFG